MTQRVTTVGAAAKLLIIRWFLVRDQEVGGSNPLAPTNLFRDFSILFNHICRLLGNRWVLGFRYVFGGMPRSMPSRSISSPFHRSANCMRLRIEHIAGGREVAVPGQISQGISGPCELPTESGKCGGVYRARMVECRPSCKPSDAVSSGSTSQCVCFALLQEIATR